MCCTCDGGGGLLEIDEFAAQAALAEVAVGPLEPPGAGGAARLQRVEARKANQTLERRRSGVVVGGVEEHCPLRFAVCAGAERARAERAERLHVVRSRGKQVS